MAVTRGSILEVAYFGDLSSKQGLLWCPAARPMQKFLCYDLISHPYADTSHQATKLPGKPQQASEYRGLSRLSRSSWAVLRSTIGLCAYPVVMIPDSTVSNPIWASFPSSRMSHLERGELLLRDSSSSVSKSVSALVAAIKSRFWCSHIYDRHN